MKNHQGHQSEPADRDAHAEILRLQEALGFAERRSDQLNEEVLEVNRRLDEVLRRLSRLEGRVESLANPPEEPDEDLGEEREPT